MGSPKLCVFLFNNLLRENKSVTLSYDRKEGLFILDERNQQRPYNYKLFIDRNLRERLSRYRNGITSRALTLASDYALDTIVLDPGDIILDVGSNLGDLFIYTLMTGVKDLVYRGFDLGPSEYRSLSRTLEYYQQSLSLAIDAQCVPVALGDSNGYQLVDYAPSTADSSLLPIPADKKQKSISVQVLTLDNYLQSAGLSELPIKILKLEAEGFEPEVLKGASFSLRQVSYICADVGPERGIKQECTLVSVLSYLSLHGFRLIEFIYPRIVIKLIRDSQSIAFERKSLSDHTEP